MFDRIKQKQVKSDRATVRAVEKVACNRHLQTTPASRKAVEMSSSD